jgi:DNA-binding winged helix-turn-helix (wHTH) protein/tetratricopeptide (TPR) repeat protein
MRKFAFAAFTFDAETGELTRNGRKIRIPSQTAYVLTILLERAGTLITREDMRQLLWPDGEFLDYDDAINRAISHIRLLLRDSSRTPRFIETIPKRGYRFVAEVQVLEPEGDPNFATAEADVVGESSPVIADSPSAQHESVAEPAPNPKSLQTFNGLLKPRGARLMWILVCVAVVASITVTAALVSRHKRATSGSTYIRMGIAPFEATGQGAEPLAESFRMELTDAVSQLPEIQVSAAHSFTNLKQNDANIRTLAQTLQLDILVFGKFALQKDRCDLQFELVKGPEAVHLATLTYSGTKDELATIRDRAQRDIYAQLKLNGHAARALRGNTDSPRAYEVYLSARYHFSQWTDDSLRQAIDQFGEAVAIDPGFARAYSGMAASHMIMAEHGAVPHAETNLKAKELATKALEIDPDLAEAHAVLGHVASVEEWNFPLAEKELRKAVQLEPNQAVYHVWFAMFLCEQGRFEESLHEIDLAHAADPFWPPVYIAEIFSSDSARQSARSMEAGRKLISMMPDWPLAHDQRGWLFWYAGKYEEAIGEWRLMAAMEKDAARMQLEDRGLEAFRHGGVPAYARVRLDAINSGAKWAHPNDFDLAEWYTYAGDSARAIDALEQVAARHDSGALKIAVNPGYADLHQEARFQTLVARIGLRLPSSYPKWIPHTADAN